MKNSIHTTITTTSLNELCFVMPTDSFTIRNEEDFAALHIAEHLFLEGAGNLSSEAVDVVADNFGGELTAEIYRDRLLFRFSYLDVLQVEAMRIFEDILMRPHLPPDRLAKVRQEVFNEQAALDAHDNAILQFYADHFRDRYGLTAGGSLHAIERVADDRILALADEVTHTPGRLFVAGSLSVAHSVEDNFLRNRPLPDDWHFEKPSIKNGSTGMVYQADDYVYVFSGFNALPNPCEALAFDFYFRQKYLVPGSVTLHSLPGLFFFFIIGPRGLSPTLVVKEIGIFNLMDNDKKSKYMTIGRSRMQHYSSDVTEANRFSIGQWVYSTV